MSASDIEDFKNQADKIFSVAYSLGHRSVTYVQFLEAMTLIKGISVDKLAKDAKYHCSQDFMHSIGFEFDDNNDLIIRPFDEHDLAVPAAAPSVNAPDGGNNDHGDVLPALANAADEGKDDLGDAVPAPHNPPKYKPIQGVFIYDGDESKLHPGMRVKISTGTVYVLPPIPEYAYQTEQSRKAQSKAGQAYQKKLRQLVYYHEKYNQSIALMKNGRVAST